MSYLHDIYSENPSAKVRYIPGEDKVFTISAALRLFTLQESLGPNWEVAIEMITVPNSRAPNLPWHVSATGWHTEGGSPRPFSEIDALKIAADTVRGIEPVEYVPPTEDALRAIFDDTPGMNGAMEALYKAGFDAARGGE